MAIDDATVTPEELGPINETAAWVEHLPMLVSQVLLRAAADGSGAMNFQARTLDARTRYLKAAIEGIAAGGLDLKGHLETEEDLEAIPTEGLKKNTAYFVNFAMRVWSGTEWTSSGSLRGDRGINLLGVWPDDVDLPPPESGLPGDSYIYRHDIHVLVPSKTGQVWEPLGIRGDRGPSNYELWLEIPGNEGKPLTEFMIASKGEKGEDGDDAFVTWKKRPGNENKTEADYDLFYKGDKGNDGANLKILGQVANQGALADKAKTDQAAWITADTGHLWIYVTENTAWTDMGKYNGTDGKPGTNGTDGRNVKITGAVANFAALPSDPKEQDVYSVQDINTLFGWIETPASPGSFTWVNLGGFKGSDGKDGISIKIIGAVDSVASLPVNAKEQDIYSVRDTNTIQAFINTEWIILGTFKGDTGSPGLDSVQYWLSLPANSGKTEADYWIAMKGETGKAGANLKVNGTVDDMDALNAIVGQVDQDAWVVDTTHRLWVWTGNPAAWKDLGPFKGTDGKSAYQNWLDLGNSGSESAFNASLKGKDGVSLVLTGVVATHNDLPNPPVNNTIYSVQDENAIYGAVEGAWLKMGQFKGADGINGKSVDIIKILTDADPTPPAPDASNRNKAYIGLDKHIYINVSGDAWEDGGTFGTPGDKGDTGEPLRLTDTVPSVSSLPAISSAKEGDAYQTADTKMTYVAIDGIWRGPFDFTGPIGNTGKQGDPGATVAIKDTYATLAALKAAHPTGTATDAYMLENGHLVIWASSVNDWKDVGQFVGPPGKEGPPGEGLPGKPGVPGPQGSRWLTLPPGVEIPSDTFVGRIGDWCVSESFNAFFKTADKGWILWGRITAGDVNSPLSSFGKAVRLGTNWVPLPIDGIKNPQKGKMYVQLVDADDATKHDWAILDLPKTIADLTAKDDIQYVRTFKAGSDNPIWAPLVVTFDQYDLLIKPTAATIVINPATDQYVNVDNSNTNPKTISIGSHTATRAKVVVVRIKGTSGVITYGGSNIRWDLRSLNGAPPELSAARTVLSFMWDGEVWVGSMGPNVSS